MLQIGNYVKIKILDCPIPECGHTPLHHHFDGRIGQLELDISNHDIGCPHRKALICSQCKALIDAHEDHTLAVHFPLAEHGWFKTSELEDMGESPAYDILDEVNTIIKEVQEHSVVETKELVPA